MKQEYKIFIFVTSPFNQRDYNRFGFEILQSRGFEVHVWDFSPFLKEEVYRNYTLHDTIETKFHELIFNQSDFYKISNRLNNSTIVVYFNLKPETRFIFNYLKEN